MKRTLFTTLLLLAACGQPAQSPQDAAMDVSANNEAAAPVDGAMSDDAAARDAADAQASDSGLTEHQVCAVMGAECSTCCNSVESDGRRELAREVVNRCGCVSDSPCDAQCFVGPVCGLDSASMACRDCVDQQIRSSAMCVQTAIARCDSEGCVAYQRCLSGCPR